MNGTRTRKTIRGRPSNRAKRFKVEISVKRAGYGAQSYEACAHVTGGGFIQMSRSPLAQECASAESPRRAAAAAMRLLSGRITNRTSTYAGRRRRSRSRRR